MTEAREDIPPKHIWPVEIITGGARNLQSYGYSYYTRLTSMTNDYATYLVGSLFQSMSLPSGFLKDISAEANKIRATASFKVMQLTMHSILEAVWLSLLGRGPLFNVNEDRGPLIKALLFCLRICYFITVGMLLYFIPTILIALFVVSIIYFNFGGYMCFVSACCISAYTTLNFAIKSWLWSRKTSVLDASVTNTSDDAATIKGLLDSSEASIHDLSQTVAESTQKPSSTDSDETDWYADSPIWAALKWHLGLFNFYDRLLQPLLRNGSDDIELNHAK